MNTTFMRILKLPSLMLAGALQVLPIVRAALPATQSAMNVIAIIFRWAAGAAALGGVQAVSGASTVITNPLNITGTNGQPFSLRLTTAPDQAHYWTASGLPSALTLTGTPGSTLWKIEGTPQVLGTYDVLLTAKDQIDSGSGRTVTGTLVLTLVSPPHSPPVITTQPVSQTVNQGQKATFSVVAGGSTPLRYQWRMNGADLDGKTNANLGLGNVTTNNAGGYAVVVTNAFGSVTSQTATLTVRVPPTITAQPLDQTVRKGQDATFTVGASGTAPLRYYWRQGATVIAKSTNACFTITNAQPVQAGIYSVIVSNAAGTATSAPATLTVFVVTSPLTLSIQGAGTVTGATNGQLLEVGGAYTLTATPGAGYLFSNWTGDITSATNALSFIMPSNLVLTATFVPNPFLPFKGRYQGLFYDPQAVRLESSGGITMSVTKRGAYSGELQIGTNRYAFSGQLALDGRGTNRVATPDPLTLEWSLDLDHSRTNYLTGQIVAEIGGWTAQLLADLTPVYGTNLCPYRGKYTLAIPGVRDPAVTNRPVGDGYATVSVDAAGLLTFSGRLADGKPITQSAQVSTNGIWPLYVPLFAGKGMVLSWVQLNTNPPPVERLRGDAALWIRPVVSASAYYPEGFNVETTAVGSAYKPANPVLPLGTNGLIQFIGGDLIAPLAFPLTLTSSNTIIGPPSLALTVTRSNGLFGGTFQLPGTNTTVLFQGVILQSHTNGYGCFRNAGQSGWVLLGTTP